MEVMDSDSQGHMFSSTLQFKSLYRLLGGVVEVLDTIDDVGDATDTRKSQVLAFLAINKPVPYVGAQELYNQDHCPSGWLILQLSMVQLMSGKWVYLCLACNWVWKTVSLAETFCSTNGS